MHKRLVLIYSAIHFVVDFACSTLITWMAWQYAGSLFTAVVFYNFFAFFMQWPLGIIADWLNKNALVSAVGCVLVSVAFWLTAHPLLACVVSGVGNAFFHLGGGIDVLNISGKKATLPGIYVSTGALGLFLGIVLTPHLVLAHILLAISVVLLGWLYVGIRGKISNEPMDFPSFSGTEIFIIMGLILTVCLRGYVGFMTSFSWKVGPWLPLLAVCVVVLGKMLGGILGDQFGFVRTAAVSLGIATVGFIFGFKHILPGMLALICFNMTMPLTLTALTNLMPRNKGMAFGLLTAALFVGGVPAFWGMNQGATPAGLAILTVLSAGLLIPALYGYNRAGREK